MTGDFQQIQSQLLAAVRADNLRRTGQGQRARFRVVGNRVALTDWAMDGELGRLEREITALSERFREASRRTLLRRVQDLSHRAMSEIVFLLLERIGMTDIQVVRRPGAPNSELHISGIAKSPAGHVPTAIVVRRDGREVGRERVTELRGALHHYGPATAGWLITTGQVLSGAREEASAHGAAPITLLDGNGFARLCEEHGVGVMETRVSLPIVDIDLFEALRGG
jgi:restriction endonuclease Mrr